MFKKLKHNLFTYIISTSWKYAAGRKKHYALFVSMSITAHLIMLINPYVMGQVFNAIQQGGPDILHNVAFWLISLAVIELVFWLFHGPSRVIERETAFYVRGQFIDSAYSKLRALPLKWHQDHHSGNTINRIRKAGDALYDFTARYFEYIWTLTNLFGPVLILFYLSWPVALVALILNVVTLSALYGFDRAIVKWLDKENEKEHKFSAVFFDYVANFTTIISLRLGGRTQSELRKRYSDIEPVFKPHVRLNEWKYFILNMAAAIMVVIVLLVYIWNEIDKNGAVMIGTAVAIYRYLDMLRHAFFGFAGTYQQILKNYTDLKSAQYIMQADRETRLEKSDQEIGFQNWNTIQIQNLSFLHNVHETPTIEKLDIDIKQGERIALVGESGSGKSTFMALIRGLYEPEKVSLHLDGAAHKTLKPLHEMTTLIPQEPEIFENTISYNITVGVDYPEDVVLQAAKLARFERVLDRLPNGLNTDVREKGVSLSGGERQRLALARGILAAKNSSIILMDEPTSSVDAHNEMEIYDNIFDHFKDRAVISSIHRLHLLGKFDTVIVMSEGKILQSGSFEELKKQSGPFKKLWKKYQQSANSEGAI